METQLITSKLASMDTNQARKPRARLWPGILLALIGLAAPLTQAATVWTGPLKTYTQPAADDPELASNQDRLTDQVWLTRARRDRMFNAKTETFTTRGISPEDTEWATGTLANFANLNYTDFTSWVDSLGGGRVNGKIVNKDAVVHLISEDIYLSIRFTFWGGNGAGGFSYQRSTPAPAVPPTVSISSPISAAEFTAPATIDISADATVTSGSVTNVEFFANALSLESDQAAPFRVTANNLAVGNYALTAVATAAGVSATSSVVNITVITAAPPPSVAITNPPAGAVFAAPAALKIAADATVSSGSITNVAFFGNLVSLGSVRGAPFRITTGSLPAGAYSLTAIATAAGVSATSSVVNITIVSPVVTTSSVPQVVNGLFSFNYSANPGLVYRVERSANLIDWVSRVTNTAAGNSVRFSEDFVIDSSLFYRVNRLPNP